MRSEDGSIIYECLSGDPEAFGILVDKYKASIYAYVYSKIRSFQDAEDVTQEVFLQAYRSLRSLRHWESFAFWLHRIARNLCNKWLRTRSRRPDGAFMEDQDPEVLEKPKRRRFTATEKLRILERADACTKEGEIGALLRSEGLYSSNLSNWRRQRDSGALAGLAPVALCAAAAAMLGLRLSVIR